MTFMLCHFVHLVGVSEQFRVAALAAVGLRLLRRQEARR